MGTAADRTDRTRNIARGPLHWLGISLRYAILAGVGLAWALPLLWLLSTSLKPEGSILALPIRWIPENPTLANYVEVFARFPLLRWLWNSVIVSSSATLLCLLIDVPAAYAFARMSFTGQQVMFWAVVATILFPVHITIVPLYLVFNKLQLLDTYFALIAPVTTNGFGIFLLRQFFMTFPRELEEAARIDGCSHLRTLLHVVLPASRPALVSAGIFVFVWTWNDFLWPLIVSSSERSMTVPVGLATFMPASQVLGQVPRYGISMAASLTATVPAVALFLLLQRYFVQGIVTSGLKG